MGVGGGRMPSDAYISHHDKSYVRYRTSRLHEYSRTKPRATSSKSEVWYGTRKDSLNDDND